MRQSLAAVKDFGTDSSISSNPNHKDFGRGSDGAGQSQLLLASFSSEGSTPAHPNNIVPWPSGLVNDFVMTVRFKVTTTLTFANARIIDASDGNTNGMRLLYVLSAGRLQVNKYIASVGTILARENTFTPAVGTEYLVHVRVSSTQGMAIWIDGVKGGVTSADTANLTSSDDAYIGSTNGGGGGLAGEGTVWDMNIWKVPAGISDANTILL